MSCLPKVQGSKDKSWTPLGDIEAEYPLDLLSIDLWSPGVTSRSDNKYVLTIIDGFSKFVQVKLLKDKSEEAVAHALVDFFTTFGYPTRVHSDLGSEFVNKTIKAVLQLLGISKSNTTAYHPQGNAYAERIHKFFCQAIASYVDDDHRTWDEIIPILAAAYNDSYHSALGCTPAEVFLGRRMNILLCQLKDQLVSTHNLAMFKGLNTFLPKHMPWYLKK